MSEIILTHNHESLHATINCYREDEYTVFESETHNGRSELRFRNVGDRNKDSSIQIYLEEYQQGKRSKSISFSIPYNMVQFFIDSLQNVKL
jgi:hypothetical protein